MSCSQLGKTLFAILSCALAARQLADGRPHEIGLREIKGIRTMHRFSIGTKIEDVDSHQRGVVVFGLWRGDS
jgi:hypothetical protein